MTAACTIVSPNYLPFARTLATSYLRHHPGHRFFVLLVADLPETLPEHGNEPFELIPVTSIGIPDLRAAAMRFDILELNTNVKPTFLLYLLRTCSLDQVVYLDPDILVTAPLEPVFQALEHADVALTPHLTAPIHDDKTPAEQEILYNGTYNLGFIAVRRSPNTEAVLAWWQERCLTLGFSEGRTGLFVDQKWMNLVPGMFPGVAILRDPGLNMAFWNLHERVLALAPDGTSLVQAQSAPAPVPLRFFHFSGIRLSDPGSLSGNSNRYTLADRPDLQPLFAAYKAAVLAAPRSALDALPYGFDAFSDGTSLTRLARRIFAAHQARWSGQDPFAAQSGFARFARQLGLVRGTLRTPRQTWSDFNPRDRRVDAVHRLLRWALRLLGPHRYELLMRYLGHISVLRHQAVFLDDSSPGRR